MSDPEFRHDMSYEQLKENMLALSAAVEVLATAPGTIIERVPQTAVHLMLLDTSDWPPKLRKGMATLRNKMLPTAAKNERAAILAARMIVSLEKQFQMLLHEYRN